jgi:ankyrin repeat protein
LAAKGHKDVVELLLANGANTDARDNERYGSRSALHLAASEGREDVAELLLENGADANAKGCSGETPLGLAPEEGHKDLANCCWPTGRRSMPR